MGCKKVAVIEDDTEIREVICAAIKAEGYDVVGFENGMVALEKLKNEKETCLILLDLMMPVMNGWDFLRSRGAFDHVVMALPVVIVSAIMDNRLAKQVLNEPNVRGYVKKPIDLDILLKMVAKYCDPIPAFPADKLA